VLRLHPDQVLAAGRHVVEVHVSQDAPGREGRGGADVAMRIDGVVVAQGRIDATADQAFMYQGGAIGHSTGSPLTDDYTGRFEFTGGIDEVDFELDPRR
jgi:hypothetical protein